MRIFMRIAEGNNYEFSPVNLTWSSEAVTKFRSDTKDGFEIRVPLQINFLVKLKYYNKGQDIQSENKQPFWELILRQNQLDNSFDILMIFLKSWVFHHKLFI